MARMKNVEGGPGDEDPRPPPRQPTEPKGKATKKLAIRKRKYPDEPQQLQRPQSVPREEALVVESGLSIHSHQRQWLHFSVLSIFMVVQLGPL